MTSVASAVHDSASGALRSRASNDIPSLLPLCTQLLQRRHQFNYLPSDSSDSIFQWQSDSSGDFVRKLVGHYSGDSLHDYLLRQRKWFRQFDLETIRCRIELISDSTCLDFDSPLNRGDIAFVEMALENDTWKYHNTLTVPEIVWAQGKYLWKSSIEECYAQFIGQRRRESEEEIVKDSDGLGEPSSDSFIVNSDNEDDYWTSYNFRPYIPTSAESVSSSNLESLRSPSSPKKGLYRTVQGLISPIELTNSNTKQFLKDGLKDENDDSDYWNNYSSAVQPNEGSHADISEEIDANKHTRVLSNPEDLEKHRLQAIHDYEVGLLHSLVGTSTDGEEGCLKVDFSISQTIIDSSSNFAMDTSHMSLQNEKQEGCTTEEERQRQIIRSLLENVKNLTALFGFSTTQVKELVNEILM